MTITNIHAAAAQAKILNAGGPGSGRRPTGEGQVQQNPQAVSALMNLAKSTRKQAGPLSLSDADDHQKLAGYLSKGDDKSAQQHLDSQDTSARDDALKAIGPKMAKKYGYNSN